MMDAQIVSTCLLQGSGTAPGLIAPAAAACRSATSPICLPRMRADHRLRCPMADWGGCSLLERPRGPAAALAIASEHRPMAGRALPAPKVFKNPPAASLAFRAKWARAGGGRRPLSYADIRPSKRGNEPTHPADPRRPPLQRRPEGPPAVIDSKHPRSGRRSWRLIHLVWRGPAFEAIYLQPPRDQQRDQLPALEPLGDRSGWWPPRPGTLPPRCSPAVRSPEGAGYLFAPER